MHITGKGKNADLNLVPYIDLLTALIAFLLITAVWTHLARLQVHQKQGNGLPEEEAPPRTKVVVMVGAEGFNLVVDEEHQSLPRTGAGHDFGALKSALDKLKAALPDREDLLVSSEDGVAFDTLVGTMDTALAAGFPALSLVDSASAGL